MKPNRIKAAIHESRVARGYNLNFPSVHVIELLGTLDFDFVWLDGEHGCFSLRDIEEHCRAAELVGATCIARVPNIASSTVLQFLDRGVQGIMGPHIATKADADQLVRACYYGPLGERSYGGNRGADYDLTFGDKREHYRERNENLLVGVLLEDAGVVTNLDGILAVDGIDYFSIGPNDFAQGLGFPGEPTRSEVVATINDVYDRIRRAGRRVGSDVMRAAWVGEMLIEGARKLVKES